MPTQKLLLPLVHNYIETDPVAAARNIQHLSEHEAIKVVKALSVGAIVKLFPYLHTEYAAKLLREAPHDVFEHIVSHIDPQQGANILLSLSHDDKQRLIDTLPQKPRN